MRRVAERLAPSTPGWTTVALALRSFLSAPMRGPRPPPSAPSEEPTPSRRRRQLPRRSTGGCGTTAPVTIPRNMKHGTLTRLRPTEKARLPPVVAYQRQQQRRNDTQLDKKAKTTKHGALWTASYDLRVPRTTRVSLPTTEGARGSSQGTPQAPLRACRADFSFRALWIGLYPLVDGEAADRERLLRRTARTSIWLRLCPIEGQRKEKLFLLILPGAGEKNRLYHTPQGHLPTTFTCLLYTSPSPRD